RMLPGAPDLTKIPSRISRWPCAKQLSTPCCTAIRTMLQSRLQLHSRPLRLTLFFVSQTREPDLIRLPYRTRSHPRTYFADRAGESSSSGLLWMRYTFASYIREQR